MINVETICHQCAYYNVLATDYYRCKVPGSCPACEPRGMGAKLSMFYTWLIDLAVVSWEADETAFNPGTVSPGTRAIINIILFNYRYNGLTERYERTQQHESVKYINVT